MFLQIQHFLRWSNPFQTILTASAKNNLKLKLSFPIALSSEDLSLFTVLRTFYKITFGDIAQQIPSLLHCFQIPLDFSDTVRSIWGEFSITARGPQARREAFRHTYSFCFSENGKYLLYEDTAGMNLLPKGSAAATTLAVFAIHPETQPPVHYLGNVERSHEAEYFTCWAFHPLLPLLCFCNFNGQLVLWRFEPSESSDINVLSQ